MITIFCSFSELTVILTQDEIHQVSNNAIVVPVVYFDQQTSARHAVRWLKSFVSGLKQVFMHVFLVIFCAFLTIFFLSSRL